MPLQAHCGYLCDSMVIVLDSRLRIVWLGLFVIFLARHPPPLPVDDKLLTNPCHPQPSGGAIAPSEVVQRPRSSVASQFLELLLAAILEWGGGGRAREYSTGTPIYYFVSALGLTLAERLRSTRKWAIICDINLQSFPKVVLQCRWSMLSFMVISKRTPDRRFNCPY